jgi:hypothetical protein
MIALFDIANQLATALKYERSCRHAPLKSGLAIPLCLFVPGMLIIKGLSRRVLIWLY